MYEGGGWTVGVGEYKVEAVDVAAAVGAGPADAPGLAGVLLVGGRVVVVAGTAEGI